MQEYKPKVKCTFSTCLRHLCPLANIAIYEHVDIIGEALGKDKVLDFDEIDDGVTYEVDKTKITITHSGGPKTCRFRIKAEGPYEDELLRKLRNKTIESVPKIELTGGVKPKGFQISEGSQIC